MKKLSGEPRKGIPCTKNKNMQMAVPALKTYTANNKTYTKGNSWWNENKSTKGGFGKQRTGARKKMRKPRSFQTYEKRAIEKPQNRELNGKIEGQDRGGAAYKMMPKKRNVMD